MLINLTKNAIKFTKRGRIEIKVQYDENKATLMVKVLDTGLGIT